MPSRHVPRRTGGSHTALTEHAPGADGSCSTATAVTTAQANMFDDADRATNAGYDYDELGRTLAVPAGQIAGGGDLAVGYTATDMVATLTQGDATKAFTLDPARRLAQATDTTAGAETRRIVNHYADPGDAPAWIATSTDAGATFTWQRTILGITGDLAAIQDGTGAVTLQLANMHGDVVATADLAGTGDQRLLRADRVRAPRASNATHPDRYGWLGAKRRSADTLAGLVLMGVRLYNPTTGRFLSVDSVPGGNANAYVYPSDPVDRVDLLGCRSRCLQSKWNKLGGRSRANPYRESLYTKGYPAVGGMTLSGQLMP